MRTLHYILADGKEVTTLAEAKASGQRYTTQMREIRKPFEDSPQMRNIRKGLFGLD